MKDMIFHFYKIFTIQTTKIFSWEESQPIFTNQCTVDYCPSCSCIQRIRISQILEPRPLLVYVGSRRLLFTLYNSKKYYSFRSDTWKVIFQLERMLLHSLFLLNSQDVKIVESRLSFFLFYFLFFIFRTLGLGMEVIGHTVTSVTFNSVVTTLITELERRKQKVLKQSDVIQHRHYMLASCLIHDHLGQGAQYLAWIICRSI